MTFDSTEISTANTTPKAFPTELERLHGMVAIYTKQALSDVQPVRVYNRCEPIIDLEAELWAQPAIYAFVASNKVRTILYLGHTGIAKDRLAPTKLVTNKLGHEVYLEACLLDPKFEVYVFPVKDGIEEDELIPYFNPPFNVYRNSIKDLYKKYKKRTTFLNFVRNNFRCDLSSITSAIGCAPKEAKNFGEELKRMGFIDFKEGKSKMNMLKWEYWSLS